MYSTEKYHSIYTEFNPAEATFLTETLTHTESRISHPYNAGCTPRTKPAAIAQNFVARNATCARSHRSRAFLLTRKAAAVVPSL
jgi:hypothetical protein